MIFEIRNNLTVMNCTPALELSTLLFNSTYSNNEIRMLYASSHGCNVNIQLYPLLDSISVANFSTLDAIFRTLVRLFPSRTWLDSKLQSTWVMQDTLQASLKLGSVLSSADKFVINEYNTASVLYRDRVDDSNAFLIFAAMAGVGTSLNRYGYNASDDPASFAYAQVLPLTWTSRVLVQADTSHAGCSLASSLLNMFDAINAVSSITSGSISTALAQISAAQAGIEAAGKAQCSADWPVLDCTAAGQRLRYRDACFEQNGAASYAAGIIAAINAGWL